MGDTAVEVMRRYCAAMEVGPEGCIAEMAPNIVLHTPCIPPPIPKVLTGREAVAATFDYLYTKLFKQFRWLELNVLATADPTIAVARAKSDIILQDGRSYSNDYCFWARIENGKIVEKHEFMDGFRVVAALEGLAGSGPEIAQ